MRRRLLLLVLPAIFALFHLFTGRWAARLHSGELASQRALADAVASWTLDKAGQTAHSPGGALFDAEWTFGTCTMAVMGLGQVTLEHPALADRYLPAMERCLDWLLSEEARSFGTLAWGEDGLAADTEPGGHAYLGYLGAALGVHRLLVPDSRYAQRHDDLTRSLVRGLAGPVERFQTYPGETYPPDQSAAAAAVALHARATGLDRDALLRDWARRWRQAAVDPGTGMLVQRLDPQGGWADGPRGSGTAFAAYFLSHAQRELSEELHRALVQQAWVHSLGLGAMREHPRSVRGRGDIDSGPVVLGLGVSATGFALGSARAQGDERVYRGMLRTAALFGLPVPHRGGRWFMTGGGIGNAIMLAMLTAPRGRPRLRQRSADSWPQHGQLSQLRQRSADSWPQHGQLSQLRQRSADSWPQHGQLSQLRQRSADS